MFQSFMCEYHFQQQKKMLSLILHWLKPSFISIFTDDEFIVKKKKNDSIIKEGLVSICFSICT